MRVLPTLLALATALPAAEPPPADGPLLAVAPAAAPDIGLIDEHRWVESVSRRRQRIETAPQPVTVLLSEDLDLWPASTLPDRLRTIGGADVYQTRAGQYDVGLRGWNGVLNSRILVLVGGLEFRQEEFGAILWRGPITMSDIERVEVVKGPASVAYGSNAFGGVISIIERQPGERHELRTFGSIGDPAAVEGDATAMGPIGGRGYYKLSVGGIRLDDYDAVDSGLTAPSPNPRAAATGDTDTEGVRAGATAGMRFGETRVEGTVRWLDLATWEMVDNLDAGSNNDPHRWFDLVGRAKGPWGEFSHTWRQAENTYENQKVVYDPALDFRFTQGTTENDEHTTRVQFDLPAGAHALAVGGEYKHWESTSNLWQLGGRFDDRSTWRTVTTRNAAVFAEDRWAVAPGWTVTAGVRADDHSRTGVGLSPRLAVNWNPDPDTTWLAAVSHGYRQPTPIETYLVDYMGADPDLGEETITAVEIGWNRRLGSGAACSVNLFASRANDLIWILPRTPAEMEQAYNEWLARYLGGDATTPLGPLVETTNLDNPRYTVGAELGGRINPWTPVTLWSNLTMTVSRYQDAIRYQSDGFVAPDLALGGAPNTFMRVDRTLDEDIDAVPMAQFNLGAVVRHDGWFASATARFVDERDYFALNQSRMLRDGIVAVGHVPGYGALDAAIGHRWGEGRLVRLVVEDLLDSRRMEQAEAPPADLALENEDEQASILGRRITLQGQWRF